MCYEHQSSKELACVRCFHNFILLSSTPSPQDAVMCVCDDDDDDHDDELLMTQQTAMNAMTSSITWSNRDS